MFAKLTETTYLFFRIACHSLWPIFHLHTIPLKRCVFLYALVSSASISFPHLFLCSLNEVHRSSTVAHALIHPIFIHRILLFLGLVEFPAGELVASDADVPPSTTSDDLDIQRTLDHVLTVQAAYGHILVDVLDEIYGLRAELASFRR